MNKNSSKSTQAACLHHGTKETEPLVQSVLEITTGLCAELFPHSTAPVTLDSDFTRDLGLDSIARVELFSRIADSWGMVLPEDALAAAQTPKELFQAVLGAEEDQPDFTTFPVHMPGETIQSETSPEAFSTLLEVLEWRTRMHPERPHLYLSQSSKEEQVITYAHLLEGALEVAGGLRELGIFPDQPVALMLPTGTDYFLAFFGILFAGGIAVPLYPPASLKHLEDHLQRQTTILNNAQASVLITISEAKPLAHLLRAQAESMKHIVEVPELRLGEKSSLRPNRRAVDIALIQYTSGSTGNPKGVVLSHAMLLANVRAIGQTMQITPKDIGVSWLPLYHDMGLIGTWFVCLYYASPLIIIPPLSFLSRPARWLWTIHHHRATLSVAPNFGYELCLNRVKDEQIQNLDLSSWRLALNGAEPIQPATLSGFAEQFAPYGYNPKIMMPVYGMAEASVALTFTPPGRGPLVEHIKREPFMQQGLAEPADSDHEENTLSFVSCGKPLEGYELRLLDEADNEVAERQVGRLEFRGPSCTTGYYRNEEANQALFHGAWLESGDYAYQAKGEIFITGRAKEVIIRAGRNIYPYALEEAVGTIPGIRKGRVAVFGSMDSKLGTERLVVLAETREKEPNALESLRQEIRVLSDQLLATPPDDIVLASPNTLLKTSSGKIRRAALKHLHETGSLGKGILPVWRQLLRLGMEALPTLRKRIRKQVREGIYGAYTWVCFGLIAAAAWIGVMVIPTQPLRCRYVQALAHLLLQVTGIPLHLQGSTNLLSPCILVINHSSYLDSFILTAALPELPHFVAKRELESSWIARLFLRRIGTLFVERYDLHESAKDNERIAQDAQSGHSLVFFPEGTLHRAPGLLPFHMGAFVIAAQNNLPVVPVVLKGTRTLLPDGTWSPHRTAVEVIIAPPVYPQGTDWTAARSLCYSARSTILQLSGETDLDPNHSSISIKTGDRA
ncbi:MAG: 4-hydroxyphenylalkanoate adenylyltransferase [Deltaproteobacteria bacterium]|nr:4-hydroxyphenylalkanoate adenylyltransferase [Deltaproteobacteria bacterium]